MKFIEEIWKPVVGYEGIYEVSSLGRVKSCERTIIRSNGREINFPDKIMKPSINHKGYLIIKLRKNVKRTDRFEQRIVSKAFIDNTLNKEQINHKNGNKKDNRAQNLEWVTNQENMAHAYKVLGRTNKDASESRKRVVEQLSDDHSVVSVFSSIQEAVDKTGINNICAVCRGIRTNAGGYKARSATRKGSDSNVSKEYETHSPFCWHVIGRVRSGMVMNGDACVAFCEIDTYGRQS